MATISASVGQTMTSLIVTRPAWSYVYTGYPKTTGGVDVEGDLSAETVFTDVFGVGYDTTIYSNACGTRVSLALLAGGMKRVGIRNIMVSVKTHPCYGKYIEPGAAKLRDFLENKWGSPENIIKSPVTFNKVKIELNGKKGIYIMIPKSPRVFGASGHATLWTGKRVIGDNHYISENTFAVYFWELK
ncbi:MULTISPECIES: T6SS effector amidase Tae4 family protein [Citrobacter]|uniref:T6SS effector amidase Tae4 family protein n=1 Tax=Citrobacter TaxID=544 RepID=UPI0015EAC1A6|nr:MULTISPECIES: T6SS effector amidase Tae4 family protein [Citrobacter]EHG7581554.1 hypothetical protein [Citrobacter sedlakii]EIQ7156973.1 hypothetical protein [Citrobacter sedlakii]MBN6599962.1 hypothetical protein [Citrobacter sedlakii]QMK45487.1 hypothetical protein HVX72_07345 [Citrobacter sp. RHB21-C05]QMK63931.1 hypothetical protein HVX68_07345 [Citrobacter sp. RHB21-C01]